MSKSRPVYFRTLHLKNIKAFAGSACLDLTHDGTLSRWTLILGDNGLGKTTLLQCLALLRPKLNVLTSGATDAAPPEFIEPALPQYENDDLTSLARFGDGLDVWLSADFTVDAELGSVAKTATTFSTSAGFTTSDTEDLKGFEYSKEIHPDFIEPVVVAYGAARHAPYSTKEPAGEGDNPAASLFNPAVELADAGAILERLDYLVARDEARAVSLLDSIKAGLARLLPDLQNADSIVIYPPPLPGKDADKTGVWVRTYSGEIPISSMSLGYQTMAAWTVDLAWRLAEAFPEAANPLEAPAIVLIDELDLHLHPRWQRELRANISDVFPAVQFIATAHSPQLAQTYLDTNLAVVRKDGDRARIENDPAVLKTWSLDEVVESVLYEMGPYGKEIEDAMRTRARLLQKQQLTPVERDLLSRANEVVITVPTERDVEDQRALDFLREAAELVRTRAG